VTSMTLNRDRATLATLDGFRLRARGPGGALCGWRPAFRTPYLSDCFGIPHYHVRSWIAVQGKIVASERFCVTSPP
jgi:hypothetical protein